MPVNHVFCLEEFDWDGDGNRKTVVSVKPLLQLVAGINPGMEFVHRRVKRKAEFKRFLGQREQRFRTVYLAFHGSSGQLHSGGETIKLCCVSDAIGRCQGGVIHLSSCSTLGAQRGKFPTEEANKLVQETGARILSSYSRAVDWDESAAFEVLLLSYLSTYGSVDTALRHLTTKHAGFIERLGWTYYTGRGGPHGAPHIPRPRRKTVRSS